jgi:hypothetical protein
MRKPPVLALLVLTSGCAHWQPQPLEIPKPDIYAADLAFCMGAAANYKAPFDLSEIFYGGVSGGAQNLTGAAVSPLVPIIGMAGGATSSLTTGIDAFGHAKDNVLRHCMIDRTRIDGSALIADPSD